jgi:hypothetical protein
MHRHKLAAPLKKLCIILAVAVVRIAGYTNRISVVVACSSQPRVGSVVTEETSLIEIMRPRVLGLLTSICFGSHVCWLIFWCGAGL